jgi:hypothetical protein
MWNVKTNVIPVITGATGTIQKMPEQHTGKARNQRATENSHIVYCTHTWESTSVKVQNI